MQKNIGRVLKIYYWFCFIIDLSVPFVLIDFSLFIKVLVHCGIKCLLIDRLLALFVLYF